MRLIIAEKYSAGRAIAEYLQHLYGIKYTQDGRAFILGDKDVVIAADGHLYQDLEPEDYNPALKDWNDESLLPVIPESWKRKPQTIPAAKETLAALQMYLPRCDRVLHACDTDPEGQLIGDEPLHRLGCKLPVDRLPILSYAQSAIGRAFQDIRPNTEFKSLAAAAIARSRGDWLWGKNGSRKYIIAANIAGYRGKISIGRVISPTLHLLARRENAIKDFAPLTHYEIKARISVDGGEEVVAVYKPPLGADASQGFDREGRLVVSKQAMAIAERIAVAKRFVLGNVDMDTTDSPAPLPYSLAPLQVAAGKEYKYSPQQVAEAAQALYASHYLISYPRGNNRYYPMVALESAVATLKAIASNIPALGRVVAEANPTLPSRAFDDSEVDPSIASHHAIMPTDTVANMEQLSVIERDIYEMICRIYIAQLYPVAKTATRRLEFMADADLLVSSLSSITEAGWRPVLGLEDRGAGMALDGIEPMTPAWLIAVGDTSVVTRPPRRMHDYDLIAALNNVAEHVDDPELKSQLGSKARLGSESTQTAIIKKLADYKYVRRDNSGFLTVTPLGLSIAKSLPAEFQGPALTAQWERDLAMIAAGKASATRFINEQISVMTDVMHRSVTIHLDSKWEPAEQQAGGTTHQQTRDSRTERKAS
jgi:DNA topoisomerase-3